MKRRFDRHALAASAAAICAAATLLSAQSAPPAGSPPPVAVPTPPPLPVPSSPTSGRGGAPTAAPAIVSNAVPVAASGPAPTSAPADWPAGSSPGSSTAPSTLPLVPALPAAAAQAPLPTAPAATGPATRPEKLTFDFKDAPTDTVLDFLARSAGFIVLKDTPVDGRVTVQGGPVTPEESLTIINAVLRTNGFTAIQQDGRILKVVKLDKAKKQNIPVHFGADPTLISSSDELITQVIPVKNVDAAKLRQDLVPLISADADFTANQGSNSLILTDSSSNILRIVKIVSNLDQHEAAASDMLVKQLTFANATNAAKLVTSVFAPDSTQAQQGGGGGGPGGGFRRMMMAQMMGGGLPGGPGGAGAADTGKATGKVTAAADDRTNTIVVVAPTDTLRLVEKLLRTLDADPAEQSEVKVFTLKFADSANTAKLINSIFSNDAGGAAGGGRQDEGNIRLPAIGGISAENRTAKVNAASDDRTNTLVVTAPSDAMKIVTGILQQLDANPSAESAFFIYHLRNGQAANLQGVLNTLFSGGTSTGASSGSNQNRGTAGNSLVSSGLGSNSGLGSSGGRGGGSSGFGSSGNNGFGGSLTSNVNNTNRGGTATGNASGTGVSAGASRAASALVGQVFVVADIDTNSLLVSTASKYQDQVKKIIEELDRPVPQVLIKVLVAEVSHDKTNDLGADFSILDTRPSGKGVIVGQGFGNQAAAANGGLVVSLMETNLNATIHALATEGKLDVLSRPYILASDNQQASITIGQEVPFITNTQVNITGQQINTIQYQAVGIILNVTPHINPDGLVILDVAPEISQLTGTTVPIGAGVSAPVIANRSASSRVAIRNGNTIVIGGMMQDQKTTTINKIPILGDIPIIGQIFQRYQDDRSKTELLIFLTPHVALEPDTLNGMSADEMKGTKLTPNAVEKGDFEDHLKGLHRGASNDLRLHQPASTDITTPPSTQPLEGVMIAPGKALDHPLRPVEPQQ